MYVTIFKNVVAVTHTDVKRVVETFGSVHVVSFLVVSPTLITANIRCGPF